MASGDKWLFSFISYRSSFVYVPELLEGHWSSPHGWNIVSQIMGIHALHSGRWLWAKGIFAFRSCAGRCEIHVLEEAKAEAGTPLPADTVWALEDMMHNDTVRDDEKVILGFILFCIYSSSRFNDAARSVGLELDKSQRMYLLETATGLYKTAITQEKRTTLLPLIALGAALHNQPWCTSWLIARRRQGIYQINQC